nr:S8 family peptidase [Marinilactibacillus kalidii]
MVGAFKASDEGITGSGINVAVIDTGFYQHPDITYAGGYSIFGDADKWTSDSDGHGTHVAGIIGASNQSPVRGIAPGVNLYGVKVYATGEGNKTTSGNLFSGIQWSIDNNMRIINISSGFENPNQDIHDAIIKATNAGIIVVAASGNGSGEIDYPAAYPEVVAVSNVGRNQTIAGDSKVSAQNELAGPGQSINGLAVNGGYTTHSGTSQATPHVAGVAALLMQKYGTSQVRGILQENALDLGPVGRDNRYGYGLVQYAPAVAEEPEPVEEQPEETEPVEEETEEAPTETPSSDESTEQETQPGETETPTDESTPETEEPVEEQPEEETKTPDSEENEAADTEETNGEQTVDISENAVWIRPGEREGSAILTEEDFASVADNGVIAVSFDATMANIDQLSLSADQVQQLRERNISLLIAKLDMEWLIPSSNFQDGETMLRFSKELQQTVSDQDQSKTPLYELDMLVDGTSIRTFETDMTYRFFTDSAEENQDLLYQWNVDEEKWTALESTYANGAVVSTINQTGTLGVFNPDAFENVKNEEETEEDETVDEDKDETSVTETSEDGNTQDPSASDSETDQTDATESNVPTPAIVASVVALASFGGGFYYFGGKPK